MRQRFVGAFLENAWKISTQLVNPVFIKEDTIREELANIPNGQNGCRKT